MNLFAPLIMPMPIIARGGGKLHANVLLLALFVTILAISFLMGFSDASFDDKDTKDTRLWKILIPTYYLGVGLYKLFNIKIGRNK